MGMLDKWLARAAAMGGTGRKLEELVLGKPGFSLGKMAGMETPRMGGMLGQGGGRDQMMGAASAMKDKLGSGADAAEEWIDNHPHLATGGAGLLGGGLGAGAVGALGGGNDQDDDDRIIEEIERRRHRGG